MTTRFASIAAALTLSLGAAVAPGLAQAAAFDAWGHEFTTAGSQPTETATATPGVYTAMNKRVARSRGDRPSAYRYSGTHAGGPANALISNGVAKPVRRPEKSAAYAYSGSHAGGTANGLISNGTPKAVARPVKGAAYRYGGSHAGGPANGLQR